MIKVILVEDHKVVAEGLERLINESGIAQVVGKAHCAVQCNELLEKTPADVILLDISLPDGSGIDLCPQIKEKYPDTKILILTSYTEPSIIMRVLENGASGYIFKNVLSEEIIEGIRVANLGENFLCKEVKNLLKNNKTQPIRLSRREQELLSLIVAGKSNSEIADKMCLGYETIKSYRKNLILKLDAHNTAQLVKIALEQKLV